MADVLADTAKIKTLLSELDREVAAVAVSPSDSKSASALAAYVKESTDRRQLRVAAPAHGQSAHDADYDRQSNLYDNAPVLAAVDTAGFSNDCQYR